MLYNDEKHLLKVSRYLTFVLRHKPESIGVKMDAHGWVSLHDLMRKTTKYALSYPMLKLIVETDDKQRYALSECERYIRANQGHSVEIDLDLPELEPPARLYHGTATRFWHAIYREGLKPMKRRHVHLTESPNTAMAVGSRHGQPKLLEVSTGAMKARGIKFYRSVNGVWLVSHVPPDCITTQRGKVT